MIGEKKKDKDSFYFYPQERWTSNGYLEFWSACSVSSLTNYVHDNLIQSVSGDRSIKNYMRAKLAAVIYIIDNSISTLWKRCQWSISLKTIKFGYDNLMQHLHTGILLSPNNFYTSLAFFKCMIKNFQDEHYTNIFLNVPNTILKLVNFV